MASFGSKENFKMKSFKLIRSLVFLIIPFSLVVGCTAAPDRILLRQHAYDDYCHMKVETQGDPLSPTEHEVVDYYGPCDERPPG